jgi:hypothetical protein
MNHSFMDDPFEGAALSQDPSFGFMVSITATGQTKDVFKPEVKFSLPSFFLVFRCAGATSDNFGVPTFGSCFSQRC